MSRLAFDSSSFRQLLHGDDMNVIDLKPEKQREVLLKISDHLRDVANDQDDATVEVELDALVQGYLDVLGQEDWFGSEGWQHYLGLD